MLIEPSPTPTRGALHAQQRGWAGSPAASSPTAPRPNAPSSSPSSWAASTPPPNNWTLFGRRSVNPSSGTGSVCRPATPKRSANVRSTPPANAAASRPPRPWTRCSWPSTPAPSRPESGHRPSCMSGSAARSSTPPWVPTWSSSCTAKATPVGQPPAPGRSSAGPTAATGWPTTRQPPRPPPRRPSPPSQPVPPTPGAGDGGRCRLSPPAPTSEQRAVPRSLSTLMFLAHVNRPGIPGGSDS
jgi:hypothetical protein